MTKLRISHVRSREFSVAKRTVRWPPVCDRRLAAILLFGLAIGCKMAGAAECSPPAEPGQLAADGCASTTTGGSFATSGDLNPAFFAQNGGSIAATGAVFLSTVGASTPAAQAVSGSTITFSVPGNSIITTGDGAAGISSSDSGSMIAANGVTVSSTAGSGILVSNGASVDFRSGSITSFAIGVNATAGGTATLSNSTISTSAPYNGALSASGAGSSITSTGAVLKTGGLSAAGASAADGGIVSLTGGGITTTGTFGAALSASDSGSSITATNVTIVTQGAGGVGAQSFDGATISLNGGSIDTHGVIALGLYSQGSGSNTIANDVAIISEQSGGTQAYGFGTITLNGASVTTLGAGNFAVRSDGIETVTNATNTAITDRGDGGIGVFASSGGAVHLSGGSVTTSGDYTYGMSNIGSGSLITGDGTSITTGGLGAHGVYAYYFSTITLANSTLRTTGDDADGLRSEGPEALVQATAGTRVTTLGASAIGALAVDGGSVHLADSTISTVGSGAYGAVVSLPGSTLVFGGSNTISTLGLAAHGVAAVNGGVLSIDAGNPLPAVTVQGAGSAIIAALGENSSTTPVAGAAPPPQTPGGLGTGRSSPVNAAPSTVSIGNGVVVQNGGVFDNVVGVLAQNGGIINLASGSSVNITGAGSIGALADAASITSTGASFTSTGVGAQVSNGGTLSSSGSVSISGHDNALVLGGQPGIVNTAVLIQTTLASANGSAIAVSGGAANVSLTDSAASGNGVWLNVANSSVANVVVDPSHVTGAAITQSGSTSNVTLNGGTLWDLTGDSNLTSLTNSASSILFSSPVNGRFKTLTTTNYLGAGGTIGLNTFLGRDGSASDTLVINGGSAMGSSFLRITNAGGGGALTTGNGILVVNVINGGATMQSEFSLANSGGYVAAGPYAYTLFRGGLDGSDPEDWYLRSTIDCPLDPSDPACAGPEPNPEPPDYRRETSLYSAIPSLALLYGRALLDTLQERVGDEEDLRNSGRVDNLASGAWGRIIGLHGNQDDGALGVLGNGPTFSYNIGAIQIGQDFLRRDHADGSRDHAGMYGAIGLVHSDVTHFDRTFAGTDDLNAYSLAGYWTHFGAQGWYIDTVLQGTRYNAGALSSEGSRLNTNGWAFATSLESGYPFRFGGFLIEPQAQIAYQTIGLDDSADTAAAVQFRDVDSLAARLGVRLAQTWKLDDSTPARITAWIRPSFWNEFHGVPQTLFLSAIGPVPFKSDISGGSVAIDAGLDARIGRTSSIFANVGYQFTTAGNSHAYDGKLGFRVMW